MAGIYVYPNQRIVTLRKAQADSNHVYGLFNKEALFAACRLLTGNELKVFLYLNSNKDGYHWALSPEDIAEKVGSTTDGIRTAIRGLIKKGYMVKRGKNTYDVYEAVLAS